MRLAALLLCLALAGCTIKPAAIGPRVQGIREAQTAAASQQVSIEQAKASSALTSAEIGKLKTLAQRSDGKASVVLQWLDYQQRKNAHLIPRP